MKKALALLLITMFLTTLLIPTTHSYQTITFQPHPYRPADGNTTKFAVLIACSGGVTYERHERRDRNDIKKLTKQLLQNGWTHDHILTLTEEQATTDAILIDTGPLPTSIEACLVCAVADRVVTVVDRNQRVDRLRKTIERLERIGADRAGVVFNRAGASDWTMFDERKDWLPGHQASALRSPPTMRLINSDTVAPLGQFLRQPTVDDIDESAERRRAA
jgi:hypothetical protein